ncbi:MULTISPECIES: hypothetical protein [unclassified Alishewanella]|uniref:hypothetical protein n=1 Tax=unclassified Alishewanella TaxID=2628974 RepID=UPI004042CA07
MKANNLLSNLQVPPSAFWQLMSFRVVVLTILLLLSVTGWLLDFPVTSWGACHISCVVKLAGD